MEKTKILRIGSIKDTNSQLLPEKKVEWTNEAISLLGITIPNNHEQIYELNYIPKVRKIENIVSV